MGSTANHAGHLSVVVGQTSSEPEEILRDLIDSTLASHSRLTVYRGLSLLPDDVLGDSPRVQVRSAGLLGSNRALWEGGRLQLIPERVSTVPALLRSGRIVNDVTLVRAARAAGGYTVGLVNDYLPAAFETAGRVVIQLVEAVPALEGAAWVSADRVDEVIETPSSPIPEFHPASAARIDRAIADNVVNLVRDGDCIEVGLGSLGAAITEALARQRRDLGIHTGLLDDNLLNLIDSGAVSNRLKKVDPGRSTVPVVMGTQDLYRRLHGRGDIVLRSVDETNSAHLIARNPNFTAINSAVQVDVLGQINTEIVRGARVSSVGGQLDFAEGAYLSPGGRSIVALRSTAADDTVSRIVSRVEFTTVPAGHADYIVTEYGIADLRGATVDQRAERIAMIAHPEFRRDLLRAIESDPLLPTKNDVPLSRAGALKHG